MQKVIVLFALFFLAGHANRLQGAETSSDAPEHTRDSTAAFKPARSFKEALEIWQTPEDINGWIAANFSYDMKRAMQLSETQRTNYAPPLSIYPPDEFFDIKAGVCVDLARFGVETLRRIDPQSDPKYLMIEFDPVHIAGNTLRLHWLVSFKRDGKAYFFADSKRPGHIAGPYSDTREFINVYEQYRVRKIVAFRELESYKKKRGTQKLKLQAPEKP
ncbi:MAG: hypothetical protein C4583_05715 [Anaerolineaceae bacterium]|nr:MAG: hypothetical protein C4583_05715 [Anaerolineaceae bacterium]